MFVILSKICTLMQHIQQLLKCPGDYKPRSCPSCGHLKLHAHATYERQADRENTIGSTLNPVKIPRFRCVRCRRTCSVLPECLSPRRWYDWRVQEQSLKARLAGLSYNAIAKQLLPSRTTISRWMNRFSQSFKLHSDHLRQKISSLCLFSEWKSFWEGCLKEIPLSQAMYHLHSAKIVIP